ncbi:DNA/RNA polymerase [Basidiobolus meristosporus CBS 931.73]|uniref:DNA-directed RNA polymerase n=1 Tax=Basidiobolus meristosporus CBS 931.73 TaxID=1314790 RepID=A0A1Y1XXC9_9FUNG|nr:DNA/RNA polymerase [Basidiobolus meristosporus CBS 931.73]|eukprot:ORX90407.1 DNA/RNA polymerase [Basidiobolus meristosporus CBS 931.73]
MDIPLADSGLVAVTMRGRSAQESVLANSGLVLSIRAPQNHTAKRGKAARTGDKQSPPPSVTQGYIWPLSGQKDKLPQGRDPFLEMPRRPHHPHLAAGQPCHPSASIARSRGGMVPGHAAVLDQMIQTPHHFEPAIAGPASFVSSSITDNLTSPHIQPYIYIYPHQMLSFAQKTLSSPHYRLVRGVSTNRPSYGSCSLSRRSSPFSRIRPWSQSRLLNNSATKQNVASVDIVRNTLGNTESLQEMFTPLGETVSTQGSRNLLILPRPRPQDFNDNTFNVSERLVVMHACLKTGDVDRARRLLTSLYKTNPQKMKELADIHVHNSLLKGYVEQNPRPHVIAAMSWFDAIKRYELSPDSTTYAILIKGFLRINSVNAAKVIAQEMMKNGYTMEQLYGNPHLDDADLKKLVGIAEELAPVKVKKEEPKAAVVPETQQEPFPDIKSSNPLGVRMLRKSLETASASYMDLYERQLKLEQQAVEAEVARLAEIDQGRGENSALLRSSQLKRMVREWHTKLVERIQEECLRASDDSKDITSSYGALLRAVSPEKLAIITINELLRSNSSGDIADGIRSTHLLLSVGKAVELEYHSDALKKKANSHLLDRRMQVQSLYSSGKLFNMTVRRAEAKKEREEIESEWVPRWTKEMQMSLGSVLVSSLIESAKVKIKHVEDATGHVEYSNEDAFYVTHQFQRGKQIGIVKFHPKLINIFKEGPLNEGIHPRLLPMLVPPKPWLTFNSGGYLTSRSLCMRIKGSPEQLAYLKEASNKDCLAVALAGLDVLGSTKWMVNRNVFDVVLQVWNSEQGLADIPPANVSRELPPKPADYDENPQARWQWQRESREILNEKRNNHSLRCDANYKVEIAKAFLDQPIYFPHNFDFRGRAYPIPPHFNHLGSDLCRGLLLFGDAKPLGERGLRWLKIHLASLAGYDKQSFDARVEYIEQNISKVFDSADRPLDGDRWWLQAEDPWQCLAACFELTNALRSPVPEEFASSLPIHQDGTCNGLQHYAALGGDTEGARQVNLIPSGAPADIYTGVANKVIELIEKEAALGVDKAQILKGKITRKVVKQTVMTNVYGVTVIGARAQISNRLREIEDLKDADVFGLSTYLTRLVFNSLGEMFTGARNLQDWLNESARRIARSIPAALLEDAINKRKNSGSGEGDAELPISASNKLLSAEQMSSVIWTTPLGVPIVQPYRKHQKKVIKTNLQNLTIVNPDAHVPVNAQKQRTAFPPNFIHSLDASHMLMSAVACKQLGLSFASVHDSYWTHACDVDTMNRVLREQFIELHQRPIMEELRNEFIERYKGYKMPMPVNEPEPKPKTKSLNLALPDDDGHDEELDGECGTKHREEETEDPSKKSKKAHKWVDLTFPPLPARGDFDVSQVKDSPYFFH